MRLDDWLLCDSTSPAAHAARSIAFATLYYRDGRCLATVAQEALIRLPKPAPAPATAP